MDKARKLYIKALNKYEEGYIDKAIDICEEIISMDIKNRACINLKGLLYYFKGDLQSASSLWKLNYEVNNDEVAKKYLQGIKHDEERLSLYISAVGFLQQMKFNDALSLLMKCKESDYNCINVDNAIATCYIKLGRSKEAARYVNNALKLDKSNDAALENRRKLVKLGATRKEIKINSFKKAAFLCLGIILVTIGIFLRKPIIDKVKNNGIMINSSVNTEKVNSAANKDYINEDDKKELEIIKDSVEGASENSGIINEGTKVTETGIKVAENVETESKAATEKSKKKEVSSKDSKNTEENVNKKSKLDESFSYKNIESYLYNKDFDNIYEYAVKWKDADLDANNRAMLDRSEEILKKEGVKYFYSKGRDYLKINADYDKAINCLSKAYAYGKDTYLSQHIVYLMGVAYESKRDSQKAINYYAEYDSNFSNGIYIKEVLYRLTLLYRDVDLSKARQYGEKLIKNYPNSEYSNSIIKSIINS
ncbi:tetratricopeptide repeat protein [Clostridium bovifaecis]|uniref:Tetratricopeptide repeat protein n=1 Tax=Clostridium bovifaecis TaxID=2184719 RepID=A0A6I6F7U9_9CLOT|nr:tetratricopeptide repeat protein [Clostridium bovifaecis]